MLKIGRKKALNKTLINKYYSSDRLLENNILNMR